MSISKKIEEWTKEGWEKWQEEWEEMTKKDREWRRQKKKVTRERKKEEWLEKTKDMEEKWGKNCYNKREEMIMIHDLKIIFKVLSINARYCFFDSIEKLKKKKKDYFDRSIVNCQI